MSKLTYISFAFVVVLFGCKDSDDDSSPPSDGNTAEEGMPERNPRSVSWVKVFGTEGYDNGANFAIETPDGGYIVAGWTWDFFPFGHEEASLTKLDSFGGYDSSWESNVIFFGGGHSYSVSQALDGGYIAGANAKLLKLDFQGNIGNIFSTAFGDYLSVVAHSAQPTSDGGYIVAGYSISSGSFLIYVVKLDSFGNLDPIWQENPRTFDRGEAQYVQQTEDGGYIITAWVWDTLETLLIKLDSFGNFDVTWEENPKSYGGDGANSVQQTSDGGYVIARDICDRDASIIKVDSQGNLDSTWPENPKNLGRGEANFVLQSSDGGYVVAGSKAGRVSLIKLDLKGNYDSSWEHNPRFFGAGKAFSVQSTSDGGYIVAGKTAGAATDAYIIKLAPDSF